LYVLNEELKLADIKQSKNLIDICKLLSEQYDLKEVSPEIRKPAVILLMCSSLLISHTFLAINIWTSRALSGVISPIAIGNLLLISGLIGAVAGLSLGVIIKKRGPGLALIIGWISLLIGVIVLILIDDITLNANIIWVGLGLGFSGISGGILLPSVLFYSQVISPERRGTLSGLVNASNFIGIAFVPISFAPLFQDNSIGIRGVYYLILGLSILFLFFGVFL